VRSKGHVRFGRGLREKGWQQHLALSLPYTRAVHQEEYTPCPTKLNQAIDTAHRCVRLAAPRRHLDQCPWSILSKRAFKLGNSFYLAVTQPRVRQPAQPGTQRII